jgi:tetratricopeptide (TPR) repeat protein
MALAYQQLDNWAAARDEYQKAYDLDPKTEVDNLYFMGPLDESLGRGKQALGDYTKYLQYAPKGTYATQANARYQKLYFNANAVEKLQTHQEIAAQAATGQAFNDAIQLQTAGKLDEAIAKYEEALKGNPNSDQIWYSLGTAKQGKNDLAGAIECYQKAIQFNPKEATYKKTLKDAKGALAAPYIEDAYNKQTKENNIPGAITAYLNALKYDSDDAGLHMNLGTAYQANKNYQQALSSYLKAINLDPKTPDAHYFLGTLYETMSKVADAKIEYAKYVQMAPSGPYAAESKNRLKLLK